MQGYCWGTVAGSRLQATFLRARGLENTLFNIAVSNYMDIHAAAREEQGTMMYLFHGVVSQQSKRGVPPVDMTTVTGRAAYMYAEPTARFSPQRPTCTCMYWHMYMYVRRWLLRPVVAGSSSTPARAWSCLCSSGHFWPFTPLRREARNTSGGRAERTTGSGCLRPCRRAYMYPRGRSGWSRAVL